MLLSMPGILQVKSVPENSEEVKVQCNSKVTHDTSEAEVLKLGEIKLDNSAKRFNENERTL